MRCRRGAHAFHRGHVRVPAGGRDAGAAAARRRAARGRRLAAPAARHRGGGARQARRAQPRARETVAGSGRVRLRRERRRGARGGRPRLPVREPLRPEPRRYARALRSRIARRSARTRLRGARFACRRARAALPSGRSDRRVPARARRARGRGSPVHLPRRLDVAGSAHRAPPRADCGAGVRSRRAAGEPRVHRAGLRRCARRGRYVSRGPAALGAGGLRSALPRGDPGRRTPALRDRDGDRRRHAAAGVPLRRHPRARVRPGRDRRARRGRRGRARVRHGPRHHARLRRRADRRGDRLRDLLLRAAFRRRAGGRLVRAHLADPAPRPRRVRGELLRDALRRLSRARAARSLRGRRARRRRRRHALGAARNPGARRGSGRRGPRRTPGAALAVAAQGAARGARAPHRARARRSSGTSARSGTTTSGG